MNGFQADDQKQINNFDNTVRTSDGDCSAGRRLRQHFRKIDFQGASVSQINGKRLERPCLMHFSQVFDRHEDIVKQWRSLSKLHTPVGLFDPPTLHLRLRSQLLQPLPMAHQFLDLAQNPQPAANKRRQTARTPALP